MRGALKVVTLRWVFEEIANAGDGGMKYVFLGAIVAFGLFGADMSYAASCKSGQITCEQWCNKYSVARNGPKSMNACFNSCARKKNGNATCVGDK
jgi:hypothetical protein